MVSLSGLVIFLVAQRPSLVSKNEPISAPTISPMRASQSKGPISQDSWSRETFFQGYLTEILCTSFGSFRGRSLNAPRVGLSGPYFFAERHPFMKFPDSAVALVDELNRLVPERVPEAGESMESIQRQAGKRELVLFLNHWRDAAKRDVVRKERRR